jgi:hypothetical protein
LLLSALVHSSPAPRHTGRARHTLASSLQPARAAQQSVRAAAIATRASKGQQPAPVPQGNNDNLVASLCFAALWAGLVGYAFFLSPNQTPTRDMLFLERLVNLKTDADVTVNTVFYGIFNIMGVYPALYACLLVPAARSDNKVAAGRGGRAWRAPAPAVRLPCARGCHAAPGSAAAPWLRSPAAGPSAPPCAPPLPCRRCAGARLALRGAVLWLRGLCAAALLRLLAAAEAARADAPAQGRARGMEQAVHEG